LRCYMILEEKSGDRELVLSDTWKVRGATKDAMNESGTYHL
jgi:hypothetical protein